MRNFIRRLLFIIPTLLVISVITFITGQLSTPDPVEVRNGTTYAGALDDPEAQSRNYAAQAQAWGVYGPLFYCALSTSVYPDTLYRIFPYWRRDKLVHLAGATGSWPPVSAYESAVAQLVRTAEVLRDSLPEFSELNGDIKTLNFTDQLDSIGAVVVRWKALAQQFPVLQPATDTLAARYQILAWASQHQPVVWPRWHWYGLDNQYHRWLSDFIFPTKRQGSLWTQLYDPIKTTIWINGLALLLAFGLSIPLALYAIRYHKRWPDRLMRWCLLITYALPAIWLGCVIQLLFGTKGYYFDWTGGIDIPSLSMARARDGHGFWQWAWVYRAKLTLPVVALTIHTMAILALQLRGSLLATQRQDYMRTAKSKGLSATKALLRHALPNALFPMIAALTTTLPTVIGGSIAVEAIFNFHGMGEVMLTAFQHQDYPLLLSIVLLLSMVTIAANLLGDFLYTWLDPRVKM